jgi:AraC family transcriptional regulator of arabinose operon
MSIRELPPPPPGVLIADCAVEPQGYHIRRPHGARNWLITYTTAGAGRYGHAAGAHRCLAGEVVLLAPGTPHDYATAESDEP